MALGRSPRDQQFLRSFGSPLPIINSDAGHFTGVESRSFYPTPNQDAVSTNGPAQYIGMQVEMQKSRNIAPTNQGHRAALASRRSMMIDPRDNPSRSQVNEGYTIPVQEFRAVNAWQTPSGQNTAGKRQSQPSMKFVSPFNSPIKTRMPWDL